MDENGALHRYLWWFMAVRPLGGGVTMTPRTHHLSPWAIPFWTWKKVAEINHRNWCLDGTSSVLLDGSAPRGGVINDPVHHHWSPRAIPFLDRKTGPCGWSMCGKKGSIRIKQSRNPHSPVKQGGTVGPPIHILGLHPGGVARTPLASVLG